LRHSVVKWRLVTDSVVGLCYCAPAPARSKPSKGRRAPRLYYAFVEYGSSAWQPQEFLFGGARGSGNGSASVGSRSELVPVAGHSPTSWSSFAIGYMI